MILPATFEIARRFAQEQVAYWLIGGNATELVVGHDIRDHDDIDFMVSASCAPRALRILESLGFAHAHGSLDAGDVFYRRGELLVDLVPVQDDTDPPRTLGALGDIRWPSGMLTPYLAAYGEERVSTLTPQMQLRMKTVVADFFGVPLREKDLQDVRALQACATGDAILLGGAG